MNDAQSDDDSTDTPTPALLSRAQVQFDDSSSSDDSSVDSSSSDDSSVGPWYTKSRVRVSTVSSSSSSSDSDSVHSFDSDSSFSMGLPDLKDQVNCDSSVGSSDSDYTSNVSI